jgi:transposase
MLLMSGGAFGARSEALRGELTTAQLAAKHGIHVTMVGEWKRQAQAGLASLFSGPPVSDNEQQTEAALEKLHAKIGQLVVERGCADLRQLR